MKNCNLLHHNLIDYVEKTLPPELMQQIDAHVAGCSACLKLVSAVSPIWETTSKAKNTEIRPFAETRILHKVNEYLEQDTPSVASVFFKIKPAYATAVVMVAIALGIALGNLQSLTKLKARQQVASEMQIRNDLNVPELITDSFFDFSE
jgi:hypothetical protein